MPPAALLCVLALSLSAAPAAASDTARAVEELRKAAEFVRSSQDDIAVQESADGKSWSAPKRVAREKALRALYSDLAAMQYKTAIDAGAPAQAKPDAEAALARLRSERRSLLADADAVAIDAAELENSSYSCWNVCTPTWYGQSCQRHCCCAVAAVRGGRKLDQSVDREIAGLHRSLQEVSAKHSESPALASLEAARLYERMATAASKAKALPAAPAAPPAAPRTGGGELSARAIYQRAAPAVVLIVAASDGGQGEVGTGSVIDEDGRVLTNAHVVIRDSTARPYDKVRVYFKPARLTGDPKQDLQDGRLAKVVKHDRALDLALLELEDPPAGLAVLPFGDSGRVEAGDPVVAIGHPEQGGLWTLTQGVVSTVVANLGGVKGKNVFQTDASINRGNSGGPLIDREGGMIGVNTSMARKAADGLTITSVNFSIQSSVVRDWLAGTRARYAVVSPALGAGALAAAEKPTEAPARPAPAPAPGAKTPPHGAGDRSLPLAEPVTPAKPYKIADVIEREIAEMEDLEAEMRGEIERRRR